MPWGRLQLHLHFTSTETKPMASSGSPKIKLLESGWAGPKSQLRSSGSNPGPPPTSPDRWPVPPPAGIWPSQILTLLLVYDTNSLWASHWAPTSDILWVYLYPQGTLVYLPIWTGRYSGIIVLVPQHHHYNGIVVFCVWNNITTTLKEIFRKKNLTHNPLSFKQLLSLL